MSWIFHVLVASPTNTKPVRSQVPPRDSWSHHLLLDSSSLMQSIVVGEGLFSSLGDQLVHEHLFWTHLHQIQVDPRLGRVRR